MRVSQFQNYTFLSTPKSSLMPLFCLFMAIFCVLSGCEKKEVKSQGEAVAALPEGEVAKPKVVATTTMLKDMAKELAGQDMEVEGIMSPGGDPHLYKPKPSDASMISNANIVLTSGFHLEGWIDRLMKNAGGVDKVYIVAVDGQEPRQIEGHPDALDPHFWFDLKRWHQAAEHVGDELEKAPGVSEEVKKRIEARKKAYLTKIDETDAWARKQLATIPKEHRILVTSHDAFGYFGKAYDLDVKGVQGLSTEQEASQRDVANIIDLVNETGVPAVFFETSTNPNLTKQVSRGTKAKLAGPLYSDSIGVPGGPADTFLKTFKENVRMIVEGLGGKYEPLAD